MKKLEKIWKKKENKKKKDLKKLDSFEKMNKIKYYL